MLVSLAFMLVSLAFILVSLAFMPGKKITNQLTCRALALYSSAELFFIIFQQIFYSSFNFIFQLNQLFVFIVYHPKMKH